MNRKKLIYLSAFLVVGISILIASMRIEELLEKDPYLWKTFPAVRSWTVVSMLTDTLWLKGKTSTEVTAIIGYPEEAYGYRWCYRASGLNGRGVVSIDFDPETKIVKDCEYIPSADIYSQ